LYKTRFYTPYYQERQPANPSSPRK